MNRTSCRRGIIAGRVLAGLLLPFLAVSFRLAAADYADGAYWVNRPAANDSPVDVFYLYPTSWTATDPGQVYSTFEQVVAGATDVYQRQATAFDPFANVYAPLYRQANGELVLGLPLDEQLELLNGIPKQDVYAALDYYFAHENQDRPFILAGHSQGADILTLVLADYMKEHPEYRERMVAAYVIGYSVTEDYLAANPHLSFARGAGDTGVIISWNTEAPGATGSNPVLLPGSLVINPLNWKTDGTYAGTELNLGSLVPNADGVQEVVVPGVADAWVDADRGVVVTSADQALYGMPPVLGFSNDSFHGYDIPFYYMNIRENALRRSAIHLSTVQASMYPAATRAALESTRSFFHGVSEATRLFSAPRLEDEAAISDDALARLACGPGSGSGLEFFATPMGIWTRQESEGGYHGYDVDGWGFAAGLHRRTEIIRYGLAAGYTGQRLKMDGFDGRVDADVFHATALAGAAWGWIHLDAAVGYARAASDASRSVVFPGYARYDAKTDFDQDVWSGRLRLAYEVRLADGWRFIPAVGVEAAHVRGTHFRETCVGQSPFQHIPGFGTSTAMRMKLEGYTSVQLPVSLRVDRRFKMGTGVTLTPSVEAAWIAEVADTSPTGSAYFLDPGVLGSFETATAVPGRSRGHFSAGLQAEVRDRLTLGVNYAFETAHSYRHHRLAAQLGLAF